MIQGQVEALANKEIPDPIKAYIEAVDETLRPTHSEPTISHPYYRSTIKLRDNGAIDIFAETNQGIRVDPGTQTINIITNNLLQHTGSCKLWAAGDLKLEVDNGTHIVNHATINVDSRGDINIRTDGKVRILSASGIEIQTGGSVNISTKGSLNIAAGSNITFNASRYDFK